LDNLGLAEPSDSTRSAVADLSDDAKGAFPGDWGCFGYEWARVGSSEGDMGHSQSDGRKPNRGLGEGPARAGGGGPAVFGRPARLVCQSHPRSGNVVSALVKTVTRSLVQELLGEGESPMRWVGGTQPAAGRGPG